MLNYNSDSYNMSLLQTAIGWVAPPTCLGCGLEGHALCPVCMAVELTDFGPKCFVCHKLSVGGKTCPTCRRRFPLSQVWISTEYIDMAKELVLRYKFQHQRQAGRDMAEMMASTLGEFNNQATLAAKNYLLVPVPTASHRIRQRGFDHTRLLARGLSRALRIQYAVVLTRHGQSKQVGSSRQQRLSQAAGSYSVNRPHVITGRNILLIDDVVTTGATVAEAAKQLRKAGAKRVDGLIFAKNL